MIFWFMTFYWAGFTVAQRERAQEDFKVPYEGALPHSPTYSYTKDSHSTGITLHFSNSAWVLLRPTELSKFKELWNGTSSLSSLSEKTRKSNKGSTFSSNISRLWVLVRSGVLTHDLPRHSPVHNQVSNRSVVSLIKFGGHMLGWLCIAEWGLVQGSHFSRYMRINYRIRADF